MYGDGGASATTEKEFTRETATQIPEIPCETDTGRHVESARTPSSPSELRGGWPAAAGDLEKSVRQITGRLPGAG
jgi:hypothetical protein